MLAIKPVGAWAVRGVCFAGVFAFGVCAMAQDQAGGSAGASSSRVDATAVALDPGVQFERVVVESDGSNRIAEDADGAAAGAGERLIYSNTLGVHAVNFPTNQPVSDDIATTAPNGCMLTRYRFKVLGKVLPTGAGGAYAVTYGLYTQCPLATGSNNATRDLVRIPGTEGVIAFPDDGPRMIEHVVPGGTHVALPTNVYLGIRFNRGNCGTVVGAPAMIGYSGDIWDFPGFPCNGYLGGFPDLPHASFWLEMFASDVCPDAFVAYKAERPSGGTALLGADVQGVDDVQLIVEDCQMVGYEVAVRGVGFYTFDLRRSCHGDPIPGTERNFVIKVGAQPLLQNARFSFDPPIALNDDNLFLGFKSSSNSSGAVVAGVEPIIGASSSDWFEIESGGCSPVIPTQGVYGAINFSVTCAGSLPTGACCDPYLTECAGGDVEGKRCLTNSDCGAPGTCEAVCRETTELNCPFPPRDLDLRPTWQAGKSCEPDPFGSNPCGVAACCYFRPHPTHAGILDHVCENLTKTECEAQKPEPVAPEWQLGEYCGLNAQKCTRYGCPDPRICGPSGCPYSNPCMPNDADCCYAICSSGPQGAFCCNTEWDDLCCQFVEQLCGSTTNCPLGEVNFVDPPRNVVDARRPHGPNDSQPPEGIRIIVVKGPSGAEKDCWSVCQSPDVPAFVQISNVAEGPSGTYTILLNQEVAPGAVAFLTYTDGQFTKTVGRFVSHPGNVNADSQSNSKDILSLIDYLNGIAPLPWDKYSGDLDHSGVIGPADIITLIDLLNGNGFAAWYGTALPSADGCP